MSSEEFKEAILNVDNIEGLFAFEGDFTVRDDTADKAHTKLLNERYKNCTLDDAIRIIHESNKDYLDIQEIGGILYYDHEYFYVVNIGTKAINDIGVLTIVYDINSVEDVRKYGSFTEGHLHNKLYGFKNDLIDFLRQNDLRAIETLLEM